MYLKGRPKAVSPCKRERASVRAEAAAMQAGQAEVQWQSERGRDGCKGRHLEACVDQRIGPRRDLADLKCAHIRECRLQGAFHDRLDILQHEVRVHAAAGPAVATVGHYARRCGDAGSDCAGALNKAAR